MHFAAFSCIALTLFYRAYSFALAASGRGFPLVCEAWKEEYFTTCHVAECEETCDNPRGSCPHYFYPRLEDCRAGCVCFPGFVRDRDGICTVASVACKHQDLADSFSRDPTWHDPLNFGRKKNRRRRLKYAMHLT